MSFPTVVFLDTSVLAGQQYNFSSAAFVSFIALAKERKLSLLLPDPTRREIMRQISDRSVAALRALEEARRRAPVLTKWQHFPKLPDSRFGDREVKRVAMREWDAFLKQFEVIELGYDGIRLDVVMGWYETVRAPFGEGKKRKEFPDAFAIASLADFAERTKTYVAVVSEDADFKKACDHFPYLMYFPSLPAVTELLLSADSTIEGTKDHVLAAKEVIEISIGEKANELGFYHDSSKYKDVEDPEVEYASIEDMRIVGLGGDDCTVAFEGSIAFSATLRWTEYSPYYDDRYGYDEPQEKSERVNDHAPISGRAKLKLKADRTGVEKVILVEFDQVEIEMSEEPWRS